MKFRSTIRVTLLTVSLLSIAACSGDDDSDEPLPASNDEGTIIADPTGEETITEDTTGDDTPVDVTLTDPTPSYPTMACGDMPLSDVQYSNSAGTPATMLPDMIATGRIDPDSANNTEHFWSIDLQPGFYHLVIESELLEETQSNLGLEVTDLNGAGDSDDKSLIKYNLIGSRARFHEFLEITQARTVNLRVTPVHDAEDYSLALFGNGTAVPTPYFDNCPPVVPLSLGTTETLTLPAILPTTSQIISTAASDETQWYQIDLEAGDYRLGLAASRTDGDNRNIVYQVGYLDHYADDPRYEQLVLVNEVDTSTSTSVVLRRSEAGPVWLLLRSQNAELNLEFTLNSDI